jgi:CRISPR-associated endoribonuclease Cas6
LKSNSLNLSIELGTLKLTPSHVDKEGALDFESDMKFVCISPIVLTPPQFDERECKAFISPTLERFSELLFKSCIDRMLQFGFDEEKLKNFYNFQFTPDKNYLNKLRESGKKFARIYPVYENDIKYDLRGYTLPFQLSAPKEIIRFIYTCGLGVCTNKGFGMIDIPDYMNKKEIDTYSVYAELG